MLSHKNCNLTKILSLFPIVQAILAIVYQLVKAIREVVRKVIAKQTAHIQADI